MRLIAIEKETVSWAVPWLEGRRKLVLELRRRDASPTVPPSAIGWKRERVASSNS